MAGWWGIERLDRTGLTTGRTALVLVVMTALAVCSVVGLTFLMWEADWPMLAVAAFIGTFHGLELAGMVALARWTESDLKRLLPVAPEIEPAFERLQPRIKTFVLGFLFFFVQNEFVWILLLRLSGVEGLDEAVASFSTSPTALLAALVIFPFVGGVTSGALITVILRQVSSLILAARIIDVDVLELERYPRLASPMVRVVLLGLVLLSFLPIGLTVPADFSTSAVLVRLVLPVLLVSLGAIVALYAYPVWVLRNRIATAKETEMDLVRRWLRGDSDAMKASRIAGRADSLTVADLTAYGSYIGSLWEWPLAPHVQKLVLFGLLPPATWILAALIESAVSGLLGR